MDEDVLEKRIKFLLRWIFSDIYVNLRASKKIWDKVGLKTFHVYKYDFDFDESNLGTLQLICAGIETLGRVYLGEKDNDKGGVSKKCFTTFINTFFPEEYKEMSLEIYKRYRCGLIHSHILGYKNTIFPNRYKRNQSAKHLFFTNAENDQFVDKPDPDHQRMILDIDRFYNDFKYAVGVFCERIFDEKENIANVEKSLEDIPED